MLTKHLVGMKCAWGFWPYLPRGGSSAGQKYFTGVPFYKKKLHQTVLITEVLVVLRWAIKVPWGSSYLSAYTIFPDMFLVWVCWPFIVTSQPIRLSTNLMTLILSLSFKESRVVSIELLQRVWHTSRERLPFQTPGSVPRHFTSSDFIQDKWFKKHNPRTRKS